MADSITQLLVEDYTVEQLKLIIVRLDGAIASGDRRVQFGDQMREFQTIPDMMQARAMFIGMLREKAAAAGRVSFATTRSGY